MYLALTKGRVWMSPQPDGLPYPTTHVSLHSRLPRAAMRAVKCLLLSTAVLGLLYVLLHHSLSKPLPLNINEVLDFIHTDPQTNTTKTTRPLQLDDGQAIISNASALAWPTIGKVTASFGPLVASYEAAIATHMTYSSLHNYPTFHPPGANPVRPLVQTRLPPHHPRARTLRTRSPAAQVAFMARPRHHPHERANTTGNIPAA
jgi:hypothetical protein